MTSFTFHYACSGNDGGSKLMMSVVVWQTAGETRAGNAVQTSTQHPGIAGEIEAEFAAGPFILSTSSACTDWIFVNNVHGSCLYICCAEN